MPKKKDNSTEIKSEKRTNKIGNQSGLALKVDLEDPKQLAKLETLGGLGCTYEEMAHSFGVTQRTIANYMKDKEGLFFTTYKKAETKVKESLRRAQLTKAMKGDNTMLVWMGKQMLDQKDKTENYNTDVPFFELDEEEELTLEQAARIFKSEKDG